jgi:hypothetical protein
MRELKTAPMPGKRDRDQPNRHARPCRRSHRNLARQGDVHRSTAGKYPHLRVETLPDGEQIIHGIRLKTAEELRASQRKDEK